MCILLSCILCHELTLLHLIIDVLFVLLRFAACVAVYNVSSLEGWMYLRV